MKRTLDNTLALAQKTAESLTNGSWPSFLRTAAWNFKYDFTSQLLIFAQKPNATACASYDLWTSAPFHRRPIKGRAIALIADDASNSTLRYVFDISDTVVKNDAPDPADPVWEVTSQKEQAVRKALAEAFLPYAQQTDLHLTSDPSNFYRSIAFSIVRTHFEDYFKDGIDIETERTIQNLLTESVSAMLQFRCGLVPSANEDSLAQITDFRGTDAILSIGKATQAMAKIGLLEVSHAVHAWDAQHNGHIIATNREERRPTADLSISEDDILRALTVGPPLENGKFRLQHAAEDPNLTSEQLAAALRKEYGTGQRPFLLSSGIRGTLFWGSEGLRIERNELQEGVRITLAWKTVSERLKRLVRADLYLSQTERNCMLAWEASQKALLDRQKTGAALYALLNTLIPSHPDLHLHQEQVRAYIYENSNTACQSLANLLMQLNTQERISSNPEACAFLSSLIDVLTNPDALPSYDTNIQLEGEGGASPDISETAGRSSSATSSPSGQQGEDDIFPRQSKCSKQPLNDCTPTALKDNYFSDKTEPDHGEHSPSEHTSEHARPHFNRPKEPLMDHPELRQRELHRLERRDKVALTDLLYHYITYRYTFKAHTPELCPHDAACREEQLAAMDAILVSPSVEENLKNIRVAKDILARWFLPFDGIRPEILVEQEKVIDAAERVLSDPPEQEKEPAHKYTQDYAHNYNYPHNETIGAAGISGEDSKTLWDYESIPEADTPAQLSVRIRGARSRASAATFSSDPAFAASKRNLIEIGN